MMTFKKIITILLSFLLLIQTISIVTAFSNFELKKTDLHIKTIYINNNNINGPWDGTITHPYKKINDGLDNSSNGDTLYVFNGQYNESLIIGNRITLQGEDKNNTIIDGLYQKHVILTTQDNIIIKNFTIRNSGGYKGNSGIKLDSENNIISNCIIYRTRTGIYINYTNKNEINNCILHTNGEGLFVDSSHNQIIKNNCICHNGLGINIQNSTNLQIQDCYAHTNGIACFANNSSNINFSYNGFYNNNDNQGGFNLVYCNNIEIYNCNIYHNGFGLGIAKSEKINISYSDFCFNTHSAFYVQTNSTDVKVDNCEISNNFRHGIVIENCNCIFTNNNIYSSIFGLESKYSTCNARKNWWGSFLGPSLFEHKRRDRILSQHGRLKIFPWRLIKNANAGSNWNINDDLYQLNINNSRFKQIKLTGIDSDNDLVPDWWEENYSYNPLEWNDHKNLDPDNDGLNNIEECYTYQYGSNPFNKDVFIEFDWMKLNNTNISKLLQSDLMKLLIQRFKQKNITLHLDRGDLGGGEEIAYKSYLSDADMRDLYWDYFLHNDLNNPRKGIFHYCIINDYGPFPGTPGYAIIAWDHLDTFDISVEYIKEQYKSVTKEQIVASVTMHELGHNFGLTVDDHGGNDNKAASIPFSIQWFKYFNYKSVMNYRYTYEILDYSDGTHGFGDFDDWGNINFSFFKNTHFNIPDKIGNI